MDDSDELFLEKREVCSNLPSSLIFPSPIEETELTPTEQKLYLELSLEFQKVLDTASSFQIGVNQWNQILLERLEQHRLSTEAWERISVIGDNCDKIQDQLDQMIDELETTNQ